MTILQACDMAPSSGGLQTYEIYCVKNYDRRRKLVSAAHNQEFVAEARLLLVFCANASAGLTSLARGLSCSLFRMQR